MDRKHDATVRQPGGLVANNLSCLSASAVSTRASEDRKRQQTWRAEYACELEALKSLSAPAAASKLDLSLVNELRAVKKVIGTSRQVKARPRDVTAKPRRAENEAAEVRRVHRLQSHGVKKHY